MKIHYNKLVRDKIPERIQKSGKEVKIHTVEGEEYFTLLKHKLNEEVEEFCADPSLEEIADIHEVLDALCDHLNFSKEQLETVKSEKNRTRGGFTKRIFLQYVVDTETAE